MSEEVKTSKYRTVEAVTFVADGKVVTFPADRVVDLADDQAKSLGSKVEKVITAKGLSFPNGGPVLGLPTPVKEVDPKTLVSGFAKPKK